MASDSHTPRRPSATAAFLRGFLFAILVGIIGPILMIVGAVGSLPNLLVIGTVMTALALVGGVVLGMRGVRRQRRAAYLERHGVRGTARVLQVQETNVTINGRPLVNLTLRVHAVGLQTFDAVKKVRVGVLEAPLLTDDLVVLVDPAEHWFEIDWGATAAAAPPSSTQSAGYASGSGAGTPPYAGGYPMGPAEGGGSATSPRRPRNSVERLRELDDLRASGDITDEEYAAARKRVLDEI